MSRGGPPDPKAALVTLPRALLGSERGDPGRGGGAPLAGPERGGTRDRVLDGGGSGRSAPLLATLVRGQGLVAPPPSEAESSAETAARLQKTIVFFGVLESAVIFAAVALIVSPPVWPLPASLFPLAVMAFNLPSRRG